MTPSRLLAVAIIYCCTAAAWFTLGVSVVRRTGEADEALAKEVARLWGGRHVQAPPRASLSPAPPPGPGQAPGDVPVALTRSRVKVGLKLDQRRKGLLWYDTYAVEFDGRYHVANPEDAAQTMKVSFPFPSAEALYDGFVFRVNGVDSPPAEDLSQGVSVQLEVPARGDVEVEVAYRSRGLGPWTYALAPSGVSQVRDFQLDMTTDFAAIDFPAGTVSPTTKAREGAGFALVWKFDSLVTGQGIGMDPPDRMNPGPLAARITFFAPVSLLFFLAGLLIVGILRGESLHPMNYFFLAAAFFAFHLLLAYLVDHLEINLAFLIASATSVFLVV